MRCSSVNNKANVSYQTHVQNFEWLGWAKNGESAGTAGYAYRSEAIRIEILPAGSKAPTDDGSKTSSTEVFLDAVNPQYGVISCGTDNKYGHPVQMVLNRLNERDIQVFQTNLKGTIIATSDGKTISFNTSPIVPPTVDPVEPIDYIVYRTETGTEYHREGCSL